jgi:hypothetical protein
VKEAPWQHIRALACAWARTQIAHGQCPLNGHKKLRSGAIGLRSGRFSLRSGGPFRFASKHRQVLTFNMNVQLLRTELDGATGKSLAGSFGKAWLALCSKALHSGGPRSRVNTHTCPLKLHTCCCVYRMSARCVYFCRYVL